eukprot:SAG11_NODE_15987_length_560_cov_1.277657_1_plen_120_part_10
MGLMRPPLKFCAVLDVQFELSPMAILMYEEPIPWYRFLTTLCAIIGGLFTVFSMVARFSDAAVETFKVRRFAMRLYRAWLELSSLENRRCQQLLRFPPARCDAVVNRQKSLTDSKLFLRT